MSSPIRVLVVDDSAFMRHVVSRLLGDDPAIEVVGTASDGRIALEKMKGLSPDVVTLDLEMPHMDGLTMLHRLMDEQPTPVIMLSAYTQEGAYAAIKALELGAVDVVAKPDGPNSPNIHHIAEALVRKVKEAAFLDAALLRGPDRVGATSRARASGARFWRPLPPSIEQGYPVIAVGSSTGGPRALHALLGGLPPDFPAAMVVAQHMPGAFTASLAARLNELSLVRVKEAVAEDRIAPGTVLIAPGGCDLYIEGDGRLRIMSSADEHRGHPSVDIMFESVAKAYGPRCIAIVLTGMGSDGARGAHEIHRAGGIVLAEDRSTCVVYGMPRQVIEDGAADMVLPLNEIPGVVADMVTHGRLTGAPVVAEPPPVHV